MPPPEPGIPQLIRHVAAPVVTLEPGAGPAAGHGAAPVVTLPPPDPPATTASD